MTDYFSQLGLNKELLRIFEDQRRALQGPSIHEILADRFVNRTNEIYSDRISEILAPKTHELLDSIYRPPLDNYRELGQYVGLDNLIQNSLASIGASAFGVNSMIDQIQATASNTRMIETMLQTLGIEQFINPLPDVSSIANLFDKVSTAAEDGIGALEEGGYGFARFLFDRRYLSSLAWITAEVRSASVTNRLLGHTRKDAFREEMKDYFMQSVSLKRRWPIIDSALSAHRSKGYLIAIPALLSQIEGALADALLLKGTILVRNGKLYRKGPDNKPALDKKISQSKLLERACFCSPIHSKNIRSSTRFLRFSQPA